MTGEEDDFKTIAFHEAGHALIAGPGSFVTVQRTGEPSETKKAFSGKTWYQDPLDRIARAEIGVAGIVAEDLSCDGLNCAVSLYDTFISDPANSETDLETMKWLEEWERIDVIERVYERLRSDWGAVEGMVELLFERFWEDPTLLAYFLQPAEVASIISNNRETPCDVLV